MKVWEKNGKTFQVINPSKGDVNTLLTDLILDLGIKADKNFGRLHQEAVASKRLESIFQKNEANISQNERLKLYFKTDVCLYLKTDYFLTGRINTKKLENNRTIQSIPLSTS